MGERSRMGIVRSEADLLDIVTELIKLPREVEWVEFKRNNSNPKEIGEYLSALSNSAALLQKPHAYMLWGVDDTTHEPVGTTFDPHASKVGNENLENWLHRLLAPEILFVFHPLMYEGCRVVLLDIQPAYRQPIQFSGTEHIRVGSYKKKLKDHPEKEALLWRVFGQATFEEAVAADNVSDDDVTKLLNFSEYFELLKLPLPESRAAVLQALHEDNLLSRSETGKWNITNFGAVLFAKKLEDFPSIKRKSVRVIMYKGEGRIETIREAEGVKGYAIGFTGLVDFITNLLPSNEIIAKALRREVPMFPDLAIRELVANALIHQDFFLTGTGPMVEIFDNRMEITNPGTSLVEANRLLDSPPRSRNEALASFMRRIGVCEERGSGVDKVVSQTEFYQLPAPLFETTESHVRAVLFAHRKFTDMDKVDRIRACYLHACLRRVQRDYMTNATLRSRFGLEESKAQVASQVISATIDAGLIRPDESVGKSKKYARYLPFWA